MYDKVLLERNRYPEYKGEIVDGSGEIIEQELVNASCGDRLRVQLVVRDGVIVDGRWSGRGCAIAQVSADLMVEGLIGGDFMRAWDLRTDFEELIGVSEGKRLATRGEEGAKDDKLGNLVALECVARMPARGKCAMLAWKIVDKLK